MGYALALRMIDFGGQLFYGEASQTHQGGIGMADPIILHIEAMLATFEQEPLRAVYMVVKQMYDLQKQSKNNIS